MSAVVAAGAAVAVTGPIGAPLSSTATSSRPGVAPAGAVARFAPRPMVGVHDAVARFDSPPNTTICQQQLAVSCYQPFQFELAYNEFGLFDKGITGAGQTIAIVDPFGSPTIAADLHTFDAAYGLQDPPSIRTITPAGPLPPFDPADGDMNGWAFETSLDVEMAHLMAPGANILVVATPVSETEGVQGFPEIVTAENYVINHHLAGVISQSLGSTEENFPSPGSLLRLRSAFRNAQRQHVSVLAASGDSGATNPLPDDIGFYDHPAVLWPASDPLVTAVGGTQLRLDKFGQRLDPDIVWNDRFGASGGGLSKIFARPAFQDGVARVTGAARGLPDVSMSGAVDGAAIIYTSYDPATAGYTIVGGTSEATPLFAGVVALADQQAGHPIGDLNPVLYDLPGHSGLPDVTFGNNTNEGVHGYPARHGYDLASGLGTVNADRLVPALAASQPSRPGP